MTYNECPKDEDGFWCSTETDEDDWHIDEEGKWGICGPGCPRVDEGNSKHNQILNIIK